MYTELAEKLSITGYAVMVYEFCYFSYKLYKLYKLYKAKAAPLFKKGGCYALFWHIKRQTTPEPL